MLSFFVQLFSATLAVVHEDSPIRKESSPLCKVFEPSDDFFVSLDIFPDTCKGVRPCDTRRRHNPSSSSVEIRQERAAISRRHRRRHPRNFSDLLQRSYLHAAAKCVAPALVSVSTSISSVRAAARKGNRATGHEVDKGTLPARAARIAHGLCDLGDDFENYIKSSSQEMPPRRSTASIFLWTAVRSLL
uniref:Pectinesterase inhibitor n=1 Tax=Steinernema glaseri TaxID=37863 RepID=A0A1I7YD43_9BILA